MHHAGGGGSSPGSTTQTLSGTAAKGLPIATTTITIKDVNGITKTGTTTANGGYTVDVTGMTLPFLLQVPSGAGSLYSVATATGTANIHPFTDLIIRNWYIAKGTTVDAVFAGSAPLLMPSIVEINAIELVVRNILSTWLTNVGLSSTFNLITFPFVANSTGFDKVLDNTTVVIDATGNVTITTPDPNNPTTPITIVSTPITQLTTPDTTPPSNPAGLLAIPVNSTSIALQWNVSTDNVGVIGYNIYRNGSKIGSSPYPAYSDTGLAAGTSYSYTVKALDGALNESAASNTATATTLPVNATINDLAGIWNGNIVWVIPGAGTSCTLTLNLAVNGNQLTGTIAGTSCTGGIMGTSNISGTVSNGIFSFNVPNSAPTNPDCANWNVPVTATLNSTLTTMTLASTGTVCGPPPASGRSETMTGTATRTTVSQYDGTYTGIIMGKRAEAGIPFTLIFTVVNGVFTVTAPIEAGDIGTVSGSGAITASAINGAGSGCPGTDTFTGQITFSSTGVATAAGSDYSSGTTGICSAATSTWTATRQ